MKVAVSAAGKTYDALLDMRFGRCKYFQIYDIENEKVKIIENKGQLSGGGAGIAAAQQLIDENIDAIITGSLGPNAYEIIDKSEIKAYKCGNIPISSALQKFNNGQLSELKEAGPAH